MLKLQVYGVNKEVSDMLRSHSDGMLKMNKNKTLPHFLPSRYVLPKYAPPTRVFFLHFLNKRKSFFRSDLGLPATNELSGDNFVAGDGRAEAHPTILSTHILWLREHNRIASRMAAAIKQKSVAYLADPRQLDEFVFQVLLYEYLFLQS